MKRLLALNVFLFIVCNYYFANGQNPEPPPKALICYYNSTSYFRDGLPFQSSDINPFLCTHIIYTFMGMKEDSNKLYSKNPFLDFGPGDVELNPDDPENAIGELDMIRKTVQLRELNPNLKILISVGGPQQSSISFSNMARHIANRTVFIQSVMRVVELYALDGIDFYWYYPAIFGGRQEDIETFVTITRDLKAAFTNLTTFTGRDYSLTTALGCTQNVIDAGYNMAQLGMYVDYFPLLCYDFKMYTPATPTIGHHSPLFYKESETPADRQLSVISGINYLLEKGALPEKLALGISTHARTYELGSPDMNNFYQLAMGVGPPGTFTKESGFLSYFEICDALQNWQDPENWQLRYDHEYKIPYVSNNLYWIGYDNEISAKEKVDFAVSKQLGGITVDIDYDDYSNLCGGWNSYPITTAIKDRLAQWDSKRIIQ